MPEWPQRKIQDCTTLLDTTSVKAPKGAFSKEWFEQAAANHDLTYLLAHTLHGVVWGKMQDGKLITSRDVFGHDFSTLAALRSEILLEARLFSQDAELLLWRYDVSDEWHVRLLKECPGCLPSYGLCIDEEHILWGTRAEKVSGQFALMADGEEGLRHAPPMPVTGQYDIRSRPLRLLVRQYLVEGEAGAIRLATGRLRGLRLSPAAQKQEGA